MSTFAAKNGTFTIFKLTLWAVHNYVSQLLLGSLDNQKWDLCNHKWNSLFGMKCQLDGKGYLFYQRGRWKFYKNWTILVRVCHGRYLSESEIYERYYWFLEIMSNPICCGRFFTLPTFDILRLSVKNDPSENLRYYKISRINPIHRYIDGIYTSS